jgi:hypothetical protein
MDTKKTLIIFGSIAAAGAALYFILKPSSAKAATPKKTPLKKSDAITDPCVLNPNSYSCVVSKGGGGIVAPKKLKDCVVSTFNCVSTTNETIQIPLDANCMDYQPAMPQCAPPPPFGGGYKVAPPDYQISNDAYYSGYTDLRDQTMYGVYDITSSDYIADYAMKPKLGGPPRGRGDYNQMLRPAYV